MIFQISFSCTCTCRQIGIRSSLADIITVTGYHEVWIKIFAFFLLPACRNYLKLLKLLLFIGFIGYYVVAQETPWVYNVPYMHSEVCFNFSCQLSELVRSHTRGEFLVISSLQDCTGTGRFFKNFECFLKYLTNSRVYYVKSLLACVLRCVTTTLYCHSIVMVTISVIANCDLQWQYRVVVVHGCG